MYSLWSILFRLLRINDEIFSRISVRPFTHSNPSKELLTQLNRRILELTLYVILKADRFDLIEISAICQAAAFCELSFVVILHSCCPS